MKKTETTITKNLYCIYDKVDGEYLTQFSAYCHSAGSYIRAVLNMVIQNYPMPDVEVRQLLSIDGSKFRIYDWDSYKFPESKAENLAPLGITPDEAKRLFDEKAKEMTDKNKEKEEDHPNE